MGGRRDPAVTSRIMSAVRSRDTRPERLLRSELFRRGLRFRLCVNDLPGRPDIVFRGQKVAVFVDGDFFHGGGWEARGFARFEEQFRRWNNPSFWEKKITSNMERDKRVNADLRGLGWRVLRIWESDIRRSPSRSAARIHRVLNNRKRP